MKKLLLTFVLLIQVFANYAQEKNGDREEVSLEKMKGSVVLFTFGQSNSANHGQGGKYLYKPKHEVYNYFDGKLYKAQDPLLGATGKGGSVWGIVGDLLIEKKKANSVTIIPIGVGGVEIAAWAEGGSCRKLLDKALDQLTKAGIRIDCICWHQGESDNIANTPASEYIERFLNIRKAFRDRGIQAPFVVATASYHPYCLEEGYGKSKEIREAQKQLAKEYDDIYPGPDTDKLDQLYQRADGVHFSHLGQRQHAALWVKSLSKILK